jgi:DNA-binding CsgD family transcriptional regulator
VASALTQRERDVVRALSAFKTKREIAADPQISTSRVREITASLRAKTHSTTTMQALLRVMARDGGGEVSKQTRRKAEREALKRERAEERERQQRAAREASTVMEVPEAATSPVELRRRTPTR